MGFFVLRPLTVLDAPAGRRFMREHWGGEQVVARNVVYLPHRGAVNRARQLKPQIPLLGEQGIPLRDEIELELLRFPQDALPRAPLT